MTAPLLRVENLKVEYRSSAGSVTAIPDLTFEVAPGETLRRGRQIGVREIDAAHGHHGPPRPKRRRDRGPRALRGKGHPEGLTGAASGDAQRGHRDGLSGPERSAQSDVEDRAPARRGADAAPERVAHRGKKPRRGHARRCASARHGERDGALPPSTFRRPEAACGHRDGALGQPAPAPARRADHRARRDGGSGGARSRRRAAREIRHLAHLHHT